jgi:hypothetical protein
MNLIIIQHTRNMILDTSYKSYNDLETLIRYNHYHNNNHSPIEVPLHTLTYGFNYITLTIF